MSPSIVSHASGNADWLTLVGRVRRLEIPFVYYKRSGIPDGSPEEDPQGE